MLNSFEKIHCDSLMFVAKLYTSLASNLCGEMGHATVSIVNTVNLRKIICEGEYTHMESHEYDISFCCFKIRHKQFKYQSKAANLQLFFFAFSFSRKGQLFSPICRNAHSFLFLLEANAI